MAVPETAGEDVAMRRKRLRYRAWHRGTREMDLVLGPFADAHADNYGPDDLNRLEALMEEQDTDLLKWVMGQEPPPEQVDTEFLALVIADHQKRIEK